MPAPRIEAFYVGEGARKGLKKGLLLALVDFLKENHYTKGWAVNTSGARDSAVRRTLKRAGLTPTGTASAIEFEIGE